MNRKIYTFGLFVLLSCPLLAQEKESIKKTIGLTYSITGGSAILNAKGSTMEGEASYSEKNNYTFGLSYMHPICSWIGIESGLELARYTITVTPMSIPGTGASSKRNRHLSLITIPIAARLHFLKYFFANAGIILDIETKNSSPIDSQTGAGVLFGIGAKYSLNNGLGVFVNGHYKFHALLSFEDNRGGYRWKLYEGGVKIGITYSF